MPEAVVTPAQLRWSGGSVSTTPLRIDVATGSVRWSGGFVIAGPGTGSSLSVTTPKLDRIMRQERIVQGDMPSQRFQTIWQRSMEAIERAFEALTQQVAENTAITNELRAVLAVAQAADAKATSVQTTVSLANSYVDPSSVITADSDGTITIAAHTRYYGSTGVAVDGGTVSGFGQGEFVQVYYNDAAREGGAVTYYGTTELIAQEGATHLVGGVIIPAMGEPPAEGTSPNPPGYAGGGTTGGVTASAFMQTVLDDPDAATVRGTIGAEPTITPGTTGQYYRGDKTFQTLNAAAVGITAAALTKTDDTNVTLTLGGTPSTALLAATSLTLGWTGLLPVSRGGTGVSSSTGTGSVVLGTAPTFTTSISLGSASSANFLFSANSGAVAGRFQLDTGGNMVFRNETSGGLFFDSYTGTITFRNYGGSSATVFRISTTDVRPGADNTVNLGTASFRWKEVFAGNATINTSDERLKDWLGPLSEAELRAGQRIAQSIGKFRWLDGNRVHVGVRAQEVARILIEEGVEDDQPLDFSPDIFVPEGERPSFRMAFLTFDTWDTQHDDDGNVVCAAGNLFGIRDGELALFLAACEAAR